MAPDFLRSQAGNALDLLSDSRGRLSPRELVFELICTWLGAGKTHYRIVCIDAK